MSAATTEVRLVRVTKKLPGRGVEIELPNGSLVYIPESVIEGRIPSAKDTHRSFHVDRAWARRVGL